MKTLAGDRECDRTIAQELERARLEFVYLDQPSGEVPSRLRGRLGPIAFARGLLYWIATGPVPLAVALDLYADPVGRTDVRVQGHRDRPPPEGPWLGWYTIAGTRVYPVAHKAEFLRIRLKWPHVIDTNVPIVFHDEPPAIGATAYVDLYHIDSETGLEVFTRALREHGVDRLVRPVWWDWHHPPTDGTAAPSALGPSSQEGERAAPWDGDTQPLGPDDD